MKFLKFWFPVIIYSGIIFYASSLSGPQIPLVFPFIDKVIHVLEYSILGYLFARALYNRDKGLPQKKILWLSVAFGLFYGFTDEFHQLYVPGRTASLGDWMADGLGSYVGGWLYPYRQRLFFRMKERGTD